MELNNEEKKEQFIKIYNSTKNIGEVFKFVDGHVTSIKIYKIENGVEVECQPPEDNEHKFFVSLPENRNKRPLSVYDEKGNLLKKIPHKDEVNHKRQAKKAVDTLLLSSKEVVQENFYSSVNPSEEFGISRFVIDRFYHLPQLLAKVELRRCKNTGSYIVGAKKTDSQGNGIAFEHRFQATSEEEAKKLSVVIIKKLQGVQHKIWLATWKLANELKKYTYECSLNDLMRLCYPKRTTYFQTNEKVEFYEHLKSLENTKIVFTKKRRKSLKSELEIEDFVEIRALEISKGIRKAHELYPEAVTLTVLNTSILQGEKMAFVGAGYKHATLELHADDTLLAQTIQTRKNQKVDSDTLTFDRDYLILLAGLMNTNETKKTQANKLLVEKLERLCKKGIIVDYPKRITQTVVLKINK